MSLLPLYINDGRPSLALSEAQIAAVSEFNRKVENEEYRYTKNACLCGNQKDSSDWLISEKDRYGISNRVVLCRLCGVVRNDPTRA